ncbi:MAG: hypothetical protein ACAH88_18795 [Roseimicrobium sp.]
MGLISAALLWWGSRWIGTVGAKHLPRSTAKNRGSLVALEFDPCELRIVERIPPSGRSLTIPWSDVTSVAVYKEDLVVVDTMVLVFRFANGAELEFCEETEGWSDLAQSLHQHLPGCIPFHEWFMRVAFPAFQINFTEIFKRESVSQVEPFQ